MGAAYLYGISGIENVTINNRVAYIEGWLRKLRSLKNEGTGPLYKNC